MIGREGRHPGQVEKNSPAKDHIPAVAVDRAALGNKMIAGFDKEGAGYCCTTFEHPSNGSAMQFKMNSKACQVFNIIQLIFKNGISLSTFSGEDNRIDLCLSPVYAPPPDWPYLPMLDLISRCVHQRINNKRFT